MILINKLKKRSFVNFIKIKYAAIPNEKVEKKEVFSKYLLLKNPTLEEFLKPDVARSNYYGNNILKAK